MAVIDGHIRCCHCGESKPVADFYPSTAAKGCGRCRMCSLAAYRAARASDPAKFNRYRRESAARNPEATRASQKKWLDRKKAEYLASPVVTGTIRCSSCRQVKVVSEFIPSVVARGCGVCRTCMQAAKRDYNRRNPEKVNAAARARRQRRGEAGRAVKREHYRNNPETHRNYNLSRYGITASHYDKLLAAQGGGCACCGVKTNRSGKRLFVDHDHVTGVVRGLLCNSCNVGIGALGDTIEGVRRALAYLEQAQVQPTVRAIPALRINLLQGAN